MDTSRRALAITAALLALGSAAPAASQTTSQADCHDVGMGAVEPLSQQPGHFMQETVISCHWKGGALDGLIMTATTIWAYENGADGKLVGGTGVLRKPGSVAVYEHENGKIAVKIENGMQRDWNGSGTGTFKLASGSAAAIQGKTVEWTGKFVAPGRSMLQATLK